MSSRSNAASWASASYGAFLQKKPAVRSARNVSVTSASPTEMAALSVRSSMSTGSSPPLSIAACSSVMSTSSSAASTSAWFCRRLRMRWSSVPALPGSLRPSATKTGLTPAMTYVRARSTTSCTTGRWSLARTTER